MLRAHVLLPFLALLAPACAAHEGESTEEDLGADEIDPKGPGGDATVTVSVPDDVRTRPVEAFADKSPTLPKLTFYVGGVLVTPGVATRIPIPAGNDGYTPIQITYAGPLGRLQSSDRFALKSGDVKTLRLGAMALKGTLPGAPTLAVDPFAISEQTNLLFNGQKYVKWAVTSATAPSTRGPVLPLLAGQYEYSYGNAIFAPKTFSVSEGGVATLDTTPADPFARLDLAKPAAIYRDASATSALLACKSVTNPGGRSVSYPSSGTFSATVFATSTATCQYTLNGFASDVISLAPNAKVSVKYARLDVNDVELTDEAPGTFVPGQYTVRRYVGETLSPASFYGATKSGVDLPPGKYHVVTTYKSLQGTPRLVEHDVDLK